MADQTIDPALVARIEASFAKQAMMTTLGARLARVAPGEVEIAMPASAHLSQQHGFVHAGAVATIADSAAGYAALTAMPEGAGILTAEFKINLLAPADGELLIATGEVVKPGRNLVITRGDAWVVKHGKATHCAMMQQTLMTMHDKPEAESKK